MPVLMPNSTQYKSYLYQEIKQRLDSPLVYSADTETYWGLDPQQNLHRAVGDLPLGVDLLEAYYELEETIGMADEYDLYSDDIKLVELDGYGLGKFNTVAFARAVNWTWGEINKYRTAQQLGALVESLNPVAAKLERLGKFFNKREHYTVLYGYPKRKIYGIFSQKGVNFQDAIFRPYVKAGDTYVISVRQLCADIKRIAYNALDRFKVRGLEQLNMGIPPILSERLTDPYVDERGNEIGTGLSYLRNLGLTRITTYNELKGSNLAQYVPNEAETGMFDPAFDRIRFSPTTYTPERHFYTRKLFDPFQKSTLRFEQIAISQTSGVIYRDFNKIWYYDFSNATA